MLTLKKISRKKGFSLIEMIVYAAIISVMSVLVVNTLLSTTQAYNVLKISRNINHSALLSLERMTRDIKIADGINVAGSTFSVHLGVLALQSGTTTKEFYVTDNILFVKENTVEIGPLTQQNVMVTDLVFHMLDNGITKAVRIEMTLQASYNKFTKSETFYSFVVLRN